MNILRTTTLVAIFIKSVIASDDPMFSQFCQALEEEDAGEAVQSHRSTRGGGIEGLDYVFDISDHYSFTMADFTRKRDVLVALYRKNSPELIGEAFNRYKFTQDDLMYAASHPNLMCSPDDLFVILGKIGEREDQEEAIRLGVSNLFKEGRVECLEPLLGALERDESFKHLGHVAAKKAFVQGLLYGNKSIVKRTRSHPAITARLYAQGLIKTGGESTHDPIFKVLLENADKRDLFAAKGNRTYRKSSKEFREAVENALSAAKPGGYRSASPAVRATLLMEETFEEEPNIGMPKDVSRLIALHMVDERSIIRPEPLAEEAWLLMSETLYEVGNLPLHLIRIVASHLPEEVVENEKPTGKPEPLVGKQKPREKKRKRNQS